MVLDSLIETLAYADSPNFLRRGSDAFESAAGYGHIFRRAVGEQWRLDGVYGLRPPDADGDRFVPVVYVCEADTYDVADHLHRLVWNQDLVPFVLVHTPSGLRLYSGFRFADKSFARDERQRGILHPLIAFNAVQDLVGTFGAQAINDGRLWRSWGATVTPDHRVYWSLLRSLRRLDAWLQGPGGLSGDQSHALIGKYVYLHYLRDRGILSTRKLESWNIPHASVFGGNATRTGLRSVNERLDDWLNGSIFPLKFSGRDAPNDDHIRRVAGTFAGDDVSGGGWQLHLDFKAYDFSYIPIETLSMIYEQFLHAPVVGAQQDDDLSRGRRAGAYYTPIPVVNFMLAELEERRPLRKGMKVLDPSAGSGAFLVQCYRRLIEQELAPAHCRPAPYQLKELLQQSIFGVDSDPDACGVASMSLVLTLLDYVDPPDLENNPRFKLPNLRDENILCEDFFCEAPPIGKLLGPRRFDWIVGNPPWKRLNPQSLDKNEKPAWEWIRAHADDCPIGGNQLGQAFAWACTTHLRSDGECALLLPAMGLFEDPSRGFRAAFFRAQRVRAVANFSNLAEVLFAGRSRVPAAAFFFAPRAAGALPGADEVVTTFSPLVANQEATRPTQVGSRNETWSIVVNGSEIRDLPLASLLEGSGLPWKLAMWGSAWDSRLLARLSRRWPALKSLEARWSSSQQRFLVEGRDDLFCVSEGLQLRDSDAGGDAVEVVEGIRGKKIVDVNALAGLRHIFAFPADSLQPLKSTVTHALKGRVRRPLRVCQPPHVIVSAARNFAVYSEEFIIVPPRQIGIVSPTDNSALLKAMALYLSSDFVFYHQFFCATQFGVKRDVATLDALRQIPVPFAGSEASAFSPWEELHRKLSNLKPQPLRGGAEEEPDLFEAHECQPALVKELNALVDDTLGLDDRERALVHDLVHVRLALNDGKLGPAAVAAPKRDNLVTYARRLKQELDAFVGDAVDRRHEVSVVWDNLSAMLEIHFTKDRAAAAKLTVLRADREDAMVLESTRRRLLEPRAQWVYFDRSLRAYEGRRTFLFKPMQRFHWTESQAMVDAGEIVAETLGAIPSQD